MTRTNEDALLLRRTKPWQRRSVQVWLAVVVLVGAIWGNAWSGDALWAPICNLSGDTDDSCPVSCPYPATITGADPAQAGVIRCYLQALSDESPSEMKKAIPSPDWTGDPTVAPEAFRHAADARGGVASVTVKQSDVDSAFALATIHFADGKSDQEPLAIINPTAWDGWRMEGVNGG
ncbi:hypothetical protein G3T36_01830 [Diaminobutyricibacter tongyongensis]|uniref:Uncharacterized protein n=1 Tax=Leifsonia tongyongensis TaxID=1268043 RepID=A0A6L9XT93_9MICO|nr:hypothetical protein [Diaminobutyricibacter tongyongensis]NEN04603.1 hypothetical protein [Diaminobutyricibacter tongyongensis]